MILRDFTKEEVRVIARALAESITMLLDNGEDPKTLSMLLGLDDYKELERKFIGIYESKEND